MYTYQYQHGELLRLEEIVVKRSPESGEYIWQVTGNHGEFSIVSHGPVGEGASCRVYEARRVNGVTGRLRLKQGLSKEPFAWQRFLRACLLQQSLLADLDTANATAGLMGVYLGEDGHLWQAQDLRNNLCYREVEEPSVHAALVSLRSFAQAVRRYHALGWLLLDLSPANLSLFQADSGTSGACVFDFDSMLTRSEVLEGRPLSASSRYAAPELLRGERRRIGQQADVYSLGMIFFEKLTGRLPHPVREKRSTSRFDLSDPSRPQLMETLSPAAKKALADFFRHTVVSGVEERYPGMDELLEAVERLLRLTDPEAVQTPRLKRQNIQPTSRFQGREDVLHAIQESFQRADTRAVLLHGTGGAGKSETARQYAALHRDDYAGINFLVYAGEDAKALVERLELAAGEAAELDGRSLILLDNLDLEPALFCALLTELLERTGEARVLVTTRTRPTAELPRCVELPLTEEAGLALSVFRASLARDLRAEEEALVQNILAAVGYNTYAADMIARELAARPELTPAALWERMETVGIAHALPGEISTGKDRDYAPAPFARQVEKLFADVLSQDFTLQEALVLALLSHAPAEYLPRSPLCQVVGDREGAVLADRAVERLLRRGWVRQVTPDGQAAVGMHPLAAQALSGRLAVTGEQTRTLLANLLTLTDMETPLFQTFRSLISPCGHQALPAQRQEEKQRDLALLKALDARSGRYHFPLWLDDEIGFDLLGGFGISAVAGNGESARYFCYLEEINASLQYLEVSGRSYAPSAEQLRVDIQELCPKADDRVSLLLVRTWDEGAQTFDLSPLVHGTEEQRLALHGPLYAPPRKKRTHKVYLEPLSLRCRIVSKRLHGGFPAVPVTRIGRKAFLGMEQLRQIVLPDTLRVIEEDAFSQSGLVGLTLPPTAHSVSVGERAFFGCQRLERVVLGEGVTAISSHAFAECGALKEASLPSTLRTLGPGTFQRTALTRLSLPEGLTTVGEWAFRYTPLESLSLPSSMQRIGAYAFAFCEKLTDIQWGGGLTHIGQGAFFGCRALKQLCLPNALQSVEPLAFDSCSRLSALSLPKSTEFTGLALENCPLEALCLNGTAAISPSVWTQILSTAPSHVYFQVDETHYMRYEHVQGEYILSPVLFQL